MNVLHCGVARPGGRYRVRPVLRWACARRRRMATGNIAVALHETGSAVQGAVP